MTSKSVKIAQKARRSFTKRRIVFLVKLLVAALVMAILVRRIQPTRILDALGSAHTAYFALAFALLVPNLYIQFFKWRYLLRLVKPEVTRSETLASLFAGFTFGLITPGRVGEFGRVIFIRDRPWITLLGLTLLDKLYSAAIVFLSGTLGLLLFLGDRLDVDLVLWPVVVFAVVSLSLLFYFVFHPHAIRTLLYGLNITLPAREKIKLFIASFDNFRKRQAISLLGLCALFYSVFLGQFYMLVLAFENVHPWQAFKAASSTLFVKALLPISLGDLGIRERAAMEFFSYIHVQDTTAFNASLMLFAINVLLPSLIGLVFILKNRLGNGLYGQRAE